LRAMPRQAFADDLAGLHVEGLGLGKVLRSGGLDSARSRSRSI
jgi:hypothetical protein